MFGLTTPLNEINGIGSKFLGKLHRLHIETVRELLWHLPTRYEDYSKIYSIAELIPHQEATISATVLKVINRRTWKRNLYLMEAVLEDDSGNIKAIWFNQPYIKNILQPGRKANFSGKVALGKKDGELYLSNPTYELVSEHRALHETRHTARIVPIYPETRGFTSKGLRFLIKPLLENLPHIEETLPKEVLEQNDFPEIHTALRDIHFPATLDEALVAKRRFAFEDLFFLQLKNISERIKLSKEKAHSITADVTEIQTLIKNLPFELTPSQKQSLWEIIKDLEKPHPMNRLLQGDVGSGKTIIAAIATLITARNQFQVAFMAPTEILARQHYITFKKFFGNYEDGVALLTSNETKVWYGHSLESSMQKSSLVEHVRQKKIKIIIGTHALIQKSVEFKSLALVIVDEQHRFGVEQRAHLLKKISGKERFTPHFLSMSATPIPRTLSLTLFGDLDLSLITELPKDRKSIITKVVAPEDRAKAYQFIREQIKHGRQTFVICPRIERPEESALTETAFQRLVMKNVEEEYDKLSKTVFPDLNVGMLHGKIKPKEKERVMREFSEKKYDVLVATSVIEVGVDIPNASVMMIEGAERFGLAQLYQFRGRVGRGEHQSFCLLFTDSHSEETKKRLQSVVDAKNGFELAEKDLAIRGPGAFFGIEQTGMPDVAMLAIQNPALVKNARTAATNILTKDPELSHHKILAEQLLRFRKSIHFE